MENDNTISISTLEDIVNKVPIKDIDTFLVDLKNRLLLTQWAIEINKQMWAEIVVQSTKEMLWINDWNNEQNIHIDII